MTSREDEEFFEPTRPERPPIALSSRTVSTLLVTLTVTIAALALDPTSTPNPLSHGAGRAYLALVIATALGAAIWRAHARGDALSNRSSQVAEALIITLAPALFLIGRVQLIPIAVVLLLAALNVAFDIRSSDGREQATAMTGLTVFSLAWLGFAGAVAIDAEGRLLFPLVALITAASTICLLGEATDHRANFALAVTAAVVGFELALGTSFLNVSPYVEATLLLGAVALVASSYFVVWRAVQA